MNSPNDSFIFLGTSSGMAQPDRATSGYMIRQNSSLSFIDCGGGVVSSFLKMGLDPVNIDRIFISHTHPDHVCELPLLSQLLYLSGKDSNLDLYLPNEFVEPFKQFIKALYLFEEKLSYKLNIIGYDATLKYSKDFDLEAIPNNHLIGYESLLAKADYPNKMQSHSFKININEKSIFYSGDIASFDDIKSHLNGFDYVVMEITHCVFEEFIAFASNSNVGKFIITHLGNCDEIAVLKERIDATHIENIEIAYDGMIIDL